MNGLRNFKVKEEIYEAIEKWKLIEKGDKILISFSGGPDSTFLTFLLLKLKKRFNLKLSLFYLYHKLEGSLHPSKIKEFAKKVGLKVFIFEEDIKKFSQENRLNIEEAGRIKRYKLLLKLAKEKKFNKIATAHTLNDAFETFFMRFFREGVSLLNPPLKPKYKNIIRPLILLERNEIIKTLKDLNIEYHIDIENYFLNRTRNKIRHILVPLISEHFGFNLKKFKKFYIRLIEESEYFKNEIDKETQRLIEERRIDFIRLNKEKLIELDSFKRREVLKNILFSFNFENEIKRETLLKMEEFLLKGGKIELTKNISFLSKGNAVLFLKEIENFRLLIKEGEYEIENFCKIKITLSENKGFLPKEVLNKGILRLWERGDRAEYKGKIHKLKKFFEDKKIPFYLRNRLILAEYKGKIIWVEGYEPFLKGKDVKIEVIRWK